MFCGSAERRHPRTPASALRSASSRGAEEPIDLTEEDPAEGGGSRMMADRAGAARRLVSASF